MAASIFQAGSELGLNIGWVSGNGRAILRLQQDRNLVLYKDNQPAFQAPNAFGNGNTAIMQDDGNFVLYDQNNQPVWASGTSGNPGADLAVQDDGNLVVYLNGNATSQMSCCRRSGVSGRPGGSAYAASCRCSWWRLSQRSPLTRSAWSPLPGTTAYRTCRRG